MSKEVKEVMLTTTWIVVLILTIVFFGVGMTSRFHDWDCSNHGGLLQPNQVYQSAVVRQSAPGTAHAEADVTVTVCKDGYRP